jgi:hypothetical protein
MTVVRVDSPVQSAVPVGGILCQPLSHIGDSPFPSPQKKSGNLFEAHFLLDGERFPSDAT